MPFNTYEPHLMGRAEIDTAVGVTGDWTSITMTYAAGKFGIDDLGSIKVSFRSASDHTRFQTNDPSGPGYVTATASNGAPLKIWYESNRNIRPWHHTLYIQCLRFLSEGDTIIVRFGDQQEGSPGFRHQTFCEDWFQFRVHVDAFATYDYVVLPEEQQPGLRLQAGPAVKWCAVLPTLRTTADSFSLGVKVEDRWGNPSDQIDQTVRLVASMPVEGLPSEVHLTTENPVARLWDLRCTNPGDLRIDITDGDGRVLTQTNPMRIVESAELVHFWSDMHGQSGETVGTNSARSYFLFGRDKAFLDICAHQGNDFQIDDAFWAHLNDLTAEFNDPGRFLAIPGYEWSGNTSVGGDHNIWYRSEGRPIYRAHRYLVGERASGDTDCHTATELFDRLQQEDALVVAHVGGRFADLSYAHDAKLEPSVEVHSAWGTFEWILFDAFRAGYRVGVVAGSDGHKGRPGASYPGASKFGSYGGLTCHLLDRLDRDSLFEAFRRRRHYATTGCRVLVDMEIENLQRGMVHLPNGDQKAATARMGDIISCDNDAMAVRLDVLAHAGIERIELRDGLETVSTLLPDREERRRGRRIRVLCEGAENKGRGRLVNWDVTVTVNGDRIEAVQQHNFYNPDILPQIEGHEVTWNYVTTGGSHMVDILLEDGHSGELVFKSNQGSFAVAFDELAEFDHIQELGGLDKRVRVFRLPDAPLPEKQFIELELPRDHAREHRLYTAVYFEDGHRAWSSPIYVLPQMVE